jgi:hypothetical protein
MKTFRQKDFLCYFILKAYIQGETGGIVLETVD